MKIFSQYIFESSGISTNSNKQRKKELESWLKHKKYIDYVDALNKMLDDPKAKALLEDGFGGELGDTKLVFSVKEIPVSQLIPTQSDIDLNKSLKYILTQKKAFEQTFDKPIVINHKPIVTFRENYIIDGHHSWAQSIILNPNGKILSFNYDGDISPIQMLKAVQGTIAAVKAKQDVHQLPYNSVSGPNLYDDEMTKAKLQKYIEDIFNKDLIDDYINYIDECKDFKSIVDWLCERLMDIKSNNYPAENSPSRENMPQTFKGGTKKNDEQSALPNQRGSALNKLKDDKFIKSVIK